MPSLADVSHLYGNDLDSSPSGDAATVTGAQRTTQRVIRRLLTVATTTGQSAYPWQPTYGAGLGARIGTNYDARRLQSLVLSQLLVEPSVRRVPLPQVIVADLPTRIGAVISCTYVDVAGIRQDFSFNLNLPGG